MMDFINWLGKDANGVALFGVVLFLAFLFVMIRAHFDKTNPINLTDLLVEYVPGAKRNKLTISRFISFCGFMLTAWVFVYCAKANTLHDSWEGIGGFLLVCLGFRGWDSYLKTLRDATKPEPTGDKQ